MLFYFAQIPFKKAALCLHSAVKIELDKNAYHVCKHIRRCPDVLCQSSNAPAKELFLRPYSFCLHTRRPNPPPFKKTSAVLRENTICPQPLRYQPWTNGYRQIAYFIERYRLHILGAEASSEGFFFFLSLFSPI